MHWNWGYILATTQTLLSVAAAIGYACQGDWKRVSYWVCAAGITATVTWWF